MKILVVSFYYQPDLCAGSFRCTALIQQLALLHTDIEVITTVPNRYASFKPYAASFEHQDNVRVHRILLPSHNSGMIDQIKAFITYYRKTQELVEKQDYDMVYATSSRLFTAFLGARIAKTKGLPLYLDIRDIFADTMKDILPNSITWLTKPILSFIEKYTFGCAKRINLVSKGFSSYFRKRYHDATYRFFTNGIDKEFVSAAPQGYIKCSAKSIVTVLYAGNLGQGQGLDKIIPELAERLNGKVHFKIIGDGGQKREFEDAVKHRGLENVELLPPVSRNDLVEEYQKADVLFLHLNDYPAFEKVLPSKLFEYAAMGKPIWAGLSGFSSDFIKLEIINCEVFAPANVDDAIIKFDSLNLDVTPRTEFIKKFSRENIMRNMALDIVEFSKDNA